MHLVRRIAALLTALPSTSSFALRVLYDDVFASPRHAALVEHPECPERCGSVAAALRSHFPGLSWVQPAASMGERGVADAWDAIKRLHKDWYIEDVKDLCDRGGGNWDADTFLRRESLDVFVMAQSAWLGAVDAALDDGTPAFALARPPGHHAVSGGAMGFCIFNYAAAAATYALEKRGVERVAILDYDVHHGNGVASLLREEPRARYCSLHRGDIFPCMGMSGLENDVGPLKNLLNLPADGEGTENTWEGGYRARFTRGIEWLKEFEPQLLIVCAGYDALASDPVGGAQLLPEDYGKMSELLKEKFAGIPIAFGLEGGYDVAAGGMPRAVAATLAPFAE